MLENYAICQFYGKNYQQKWQTPEFNF